MKHFSTEVELSAAIAIGIDVGFTDSEFIDCQRALVTTMDVNPERLSPAAEKVLANFIGWFMRAKEDDRNGRYPQKPVFAYANLSKGYSIAFIAVDAKGKANLSYA